MKRLTMTVAAIALTAGGAWAQTDSTVTPTDEAAETSAEQNMNAAGDNLEQAGDNIENAAANTGAAIQDGVSNAGDRMEAMGAEANQSLQNAFGMDEDGLIRTRDITGGSVYVISDDAVEATAGEDAGMAAGATDTAATSADTSMEPAADGAMNDAGMTGYAQIEDNWEEIGSIEDVVLNADGSFSGIVAEVGGFLDIGDKHVHLTMENAELRPIDDGTYVVLVNATRDQLMEMPDVDESVME